MPRNGSGVYSLPPGSTFVPNTLAQSSVVNGINNDLATDLNTPRPIVAGGTGASTQTGALTTLGAFPGTGHDPTDPTKQVAWDLTGITTANTRTIRVPDANSSLFVWEAIGTGIYTGTGAATFDLTNLGVYRMIEIRGFINPSVSAALWARTSSNNGVSYDSGATDYITQFDSSSNTTLSAASSTSTVLAIGGAAVAPGGGATFRLLFSEFNQAANGYILGEVGLNTASLLPYKSYATRQQSTVRNALRIFPSTGTITYFIEARGLRG